MPHRGKRKTKPDPMPDVMPDALITVRLSRAQAQAISLGCTVLGMVGDTTRQMVKDANLDLPSADPVDSVVAMSVLFSEMVEGQGYDVDSILRKAVQNG